MWGSDNITSGWSTRTGESTILTAFTAALTAALAASCDSIPWTAPACVPHSRSALGRYQVVGPCRQASPGIGFLGFHGRHRQEDAEK